MPIVSTLNTLTPDAAGREKPSAQSVVAPFIAANPAAGGRDIVVGDVHGCLGRRGARSVLAVPGREVLGSAPRWRPSGEPVPVTGQAHGAHDAKAGPEEHASARGEGEGSPAVRREAVEQREGASPPRCGDDEGDAVMGRAPVGVECHWGAASG